MSLTIQTTKDNFPTSVKVKLDDEVYTLSDPCDANGNYLDDDEYPAGFYESETSYKNRDEGDLIARIQQLAKHPKAHYSEGRDSDGDHYWRVWFLLKDADNYKLIRDKVKEKERQEKEHFDNLRQRWSIKETRDPNDLQGHIVQTNSDQCSKLIAQVGGKRKSLGECYPKGNDLLLWLEELEIPDGPVCVSFSIWGICTFGPDAESRMQKIYDGFVEFEKENLKRRIGSEIRYARRFLSIDEIKSVASKSYPTCRVWVELQLTWKKEKDGKYHNHISIRVDQPYTHVRQDDPKYHKVMKALGLKKKYITDEKMKEIDIQGKKYRANDEYSSTIIAYVELPDEIVYG